MRWAIIGLIVLIVIALPGVILFSFVVTDDGDDTSGADPARAKGIPRTDAPPAPDDAAARAQAELEAADPGFGALFDAVAAGDADGLLALMDWRTEVCGQRRDVSCGNAVPGEDVRVVNAGWPVAFYVPAEVLEPTLRQTLAGTPLQLRFAAQSTEQPALYFLGFDGPDLKGPGLAPLSDPAGNITGMFLTVDTARAAPIVLVDGLLDTYSAVERGVYPGLDSQRLIYADDAY